MLGLSPSEVREYTCPLSVPLVPSSCEPQFGPHAANGCQEETKASTQDLNLYLWCQSILFQQLSSPAKVTVCNEISGVEPTALFQEEEITVKKPQEDIKIMF